MIPSSFSFLLMGLFILFTSTTSAQMEKFWFYCQTNLLVDENIEKLESLMGRASRAGYNGMLLSDSKFGRLGEMDSRYFRNAERIRLLAEKLKLEIIPCLFPVGYSESILSQDPNLVEALPIKNALLIVKNGGAFPVTEPPSILKGSDFSDPKAWSWHDDTVQFEQGAAHIKNPGGKNARIVQKLKLNPFRQYHLSVRVKTQNFPDTALILLLAGPDGKRSLNHAGLGVQPTQDWQTHHAVFNSLDQTEATLYLRAGWKPSSGELWWDDIQLEETPLLNLVRRDGAPLELQIENGRTLVEGKDFESLSDPLMGTRPWKGCYEVWHESPILRTSLPDGTRLRLSCHHAITIHDGQAMICPSEPKTMKLLEEQAQRVNALWHPSTFFMSHDEIRVLGWDESCKKRNLTPGKILASHIQDCIAILKKQKSSCQILVWSDMFDPHHNATQDPYYLVNGNFTGSWEGLPPEVSIANWNFGKRSESLGFFESRNHSQIIAGYYDQSPDQIIPWLDAAAKIKNVKGVIYTTWEKKYDDLETFIKIVRSHPLAKSSSMEKK